MFGGKMSHEVIEKLLEENTNSNWLETICLEITTDITSKKATLLELVQLLEPLLTSSDLNKHIKGLLVLAYVVEFLPNNFLSTKELDFIAQFICNQIKQHHSFISASLKAVIALVQSPEITQHNLHNITSTLFNSVVWQTQTQSDRRVFYTILQYIVFNRLEDYKSISSELLFNVISSVDGERDPRNLLLLFSFLPKLYTSVPLGPLAEDAFEVVSCYFPIDFHSSDTEHGVVTREDLVAALTPCMIVVPEFSTFCLSLIQDKLDSTLKSAKIDSYNLLIEGCKLWPSECVAPHTEGLLQAIKNDCLPPRDTHVAESAISALQAIVKLLPQAILLPFLETLFHSCQMFLSDVQLSLFEPSFRLLLAAMQASPSACTIVVNKLLPGLISLLRVTQETSRIIVLNKLMNFIQVCHHNNLDFISGGEVWRELITELQLCTQQGSAELWQAAYSSLTLVPTLLDPACRATLYSSLLFHLTTQQSATLRSTCIKCLQSLALVHGDEIEENIINKLSVEQGEEELVLKRSKFESVCSLAVVERFQPVLDQQFATLLSQGAACISMAISTLRNLLEEEDIQKNSTLIHFLFSQSSVLSTLVHLNTDGDDLLNSAKIIQILVQLQTSSEQTRVVLPLVRSLLINPKKVQKMVMMESLVGSLWPEVMVLTPEQLSREVLPEALHPSNTIPSALRLIATLINKSEDDSLLELVSQNLCHCSPDQAAIVQSYVTKALVLRAHLLMEHWLFKLVDLLDDEEVGHIAAKGFKLIVEESEGFLSHQNHCIIKLLYRQRLFHLVVPRLVASTRKVPHLTALAYLLEAVPYTVYTQYIKQITPLLVKSLDTESEGLLLPVLHTLTSLLTSSDSFLEDQVDTVIPRFLHIAKDSSFMQVRIAALQCLHNSLKSSPILLMPHKQQVLVELAHCLDDRKRLVRKEAARTRSKWFLLGAPTVES